MTTPQLIIVVVGFAVQIAGLAYIARILHLMRTSFSPGEAAIYREMRRTLDEYKP